MDIKNIAKLQAQAQQMLKDAQTAQTKGEPRASFSKDRYSTLKSNILSHDEQGNGTVLTLRDGGTKVLNYSWDEVEKILNK
tara:strand:- start:180 stop:422 length:243 start_codon:yes stop_codon:yes gene_type:complete